MDDPLGMYRKHLTDLAKIDEQARQLAGSTKAIQDAFDSINGGPTKRLLQDYIAKDALRNQSASTGAAAEIMRSSQLTEERNRWMLGLHNMRAGGTEVVPGGPKAVPPKSLPWRTSVRNRDDRVRRPSRRRPPADVGRFYFLRATTEVSEQTSVARSAPVNLTSVPPADSGA